MSIGTRVSFLERGRREVGTLRDFQMLSLEAVIETDDGLTHIVHLSQIDQPVEGFLELCQDIVRLQNEYLNERLPETELPNFESTGVKR